jgi:deoxyhypusine synthase
VRRHERAAVTTLEKPLEEKYPVHLAGYVGALRSEGLDPLEKRLVNNGFVNALIECQAKGKMSG